MTEQPQVSHAEMIKSYLERRQPQLERVLDGSKLINPQTLISQFLFVLSKTKDWETASRQSIWQSLAFCAEKRMSPINKNIHLTVYKGNCEATLGIQGIRELIRRNENVVRVGGDVVREKDEFQIVSGLKPSIHHVPNIREESSTIGAYAFVELEGGDYTIRYSNMKEILASKASSRGSHTDYSPWNKFADEMCRLVPLRKLAKEIMVNESATFGTDFDPTLEPVNQKEVEEAKPVETIDEPKPEKEGQ